MNNYVALVSDQTLRVSWVYLSANSWDEAVNQLEETGFEVVEDQTEDFSNVDLSDANERKEATIATIEELLPYVVLYS
jgi:hypothetical protein